MSLVLLASACAMGCSYVRTYRAVDSCKRGRSAAGVVGLAAARALALTGREVLVIERADAVGTGTSSRNSEIIHAGAPGCTNLLSERILELQAQGVSAVVLKSRRATSPCTPPTPPSQVVATPCAGIYYPPGSLKAKLCMEGRGRLYEYCRERNVPHKQLGKLLVATEEDEVHRLPTVLYLGRVGHTVTTFEMDFARLRAACMELHEFARYAGGTTPGLQNHLVLMPHSARIRVAACAASTVSNKCLSN